MIAFATVKGIFFSSSFCAIFWLKKQGLMPGLCFSNKLISHDEGLHFACLLYSKLINKLPESCIKIISSAVEIEMDFIVNALSVEMLSKRSVLVVRHIPRSTLLLLLESSWHKLFASQVDQTFITMTGFDCLSFSTLLHKFVPALDAYTPFNKLMI